MKFQIDLENYPYLLNLFQFNKESFAREVKYLLDNAKNITEMKENQEFFDFFHGYDEKSKEAFRLNTMDLVKSFLNAFFDYEGITAHHPNKEEAELLKYLDHENNPLSIFTGYTVVRDSEGKQITRQEFLGKDMSFTDFLQGLLYAARYLNHTEYVKATALSRYDLVEAMKHDRIIELMKIQPALEYQKLNNIVIGSRKEGTAFFDCGNSDTNICPLTKQEMLEDEKGYYSLDVLAYFKK